MLAKSWNWISDLGILNSSDIDYDLGRLYNQMCLFSGSGSLIVFLWAIYLGYPTSYLFVSFYIFAFYFVALIMNFFGKIQFVKNYIAIGSPIWICLSYVLIGGNFSQSTAVLSSMVITYVVYQKKPKLKNGLLIFSVALYFLALTYVNSLGPVFGLIDFPYDEITVFIGALGWIIIVLNIFDKDRNNLVRTLKINNEELIDTTEELERFTYIASHDLRSPLRTIISFIGLIERDVEKGNYDNIKNNLKFVKTGATQMNFLVKDVLEFSQFKNQEVTENSLLDLNAVFEKAKFMLNEEIEGKGAKISCEKLPSFIGYELDFLMLFQNFIQNGIKYNESKSPQVKITGTKTDSDFKISFVDNGIGIEEKYFEQIFQFFKRLHNSTVYQGTGLGLGLCKKIITKYKGKVEVESELGIGTTFTIVLPLKSNSN